MPRIVREPLTKLRVETAKPKRATYLLRDATVPGLALRVSPLGAKAWSIQWGRGNAKNLGHFPAMTLDGARSVARHALAEIVTHGAPLSTLAKSSAGAVETFGEFIELRYGPHIEATAKAGKATLASIKAQFGHLFDNPLASISRADFDDFKALRLNAGRHPSTVNRDLDRIKAALSRAVEWDLLPANPLGGVRRIKRGIEKRVRFLSPKEGKALRAALQSREDEARARRQSGNRWREDRGRASLARISGYTDHLMPMTLLALNTGLRRGELTQLTWADVDLPRKVLSVRAGYAKSGRERHVQLNSEAIAVLKRWKKNRPGDGRLFGVADIKKAWAALMARAGLENFRFHDLRHDFASKLVMAGVDINTVRELLGHGDIKMTLRYAHLAPEHKAAAVEKLVKK
jgi:integrase